MRADPELVKLLLLALQNGSAWSLESAATTYSDIYRPETVEASVAEARRQLAGEAPPPPPDKPLPLRDVRPPQAAFPVDALPDAVAEMVSATARFTQTDPAMAGVSALAVLAACAGGRCEVEVRPGWREPLGLFLAAAAAPGERKSAVKATMSGPLMVAEQELVEKAKPLIAEAAATREIAEAQAKAAKFVAAKEDNDQRRQAKTAEAVSAAMMAEAVVVPTMPRIIADDVTPEAAASLMADQRGRLAILSAEGGIFDVIAGRYSGNVPNLDVFLKGHAGDPIKVDRKGRDPEYIKRPALTVGLMVQPQVLLTIARNQQFRGRGLLARFLYAIPPTMVGRRDVNPDPIAADVVTRYEETVRSLAVTLAGWDDPVILTMTPDATARIISFASRVEPRLGPAGDLHHIGDWAGKLVGATARIAGLLHLAGDPGGAWRHPVEATTVDWAILLAEYFTGHALTAFSMMVADPVVADAEYLLDVLRRHRWEEVTGRDLFTASSRSRFPKAGDLGPATMLLEEHGYLIREVQEARTGPGRPPSPRWTVHPHVLIAETAETAK